ncbi:DNA repair protein RadC [Candidatus Binatia bacterium]|nr:DNA repair protein RadC [Candidatus Binatia bacterium]
MQPIPFRGSADIYALLREEAATWDRERFITLILDNKHNLIGVEEVSVGTLTAALVHPREVFKALLLANAAAFVVAHNHPSGDPTPSKEDIEITRRLREVADLFGIRMLDHVVIGRDRYVSFVDDGYW